MITIEQEEKALKGLGLFTLLLFVPLNVFILKDDVIRIMMILPLMVVFTILYYRKYARDKKEGKNLLKYKSLSFFMIISLLVFLTFLFYPMS